MTVVERERHQKLGHINKGLDRLILNLSRTNQPDCPEEVRKTIDEMMETYLRRRTTP